MFLKICYEKRNKQMIVMSVFYISSESSIKTFLINKYHKKSGHFLFYNWVLLKSKSEMNF